MVRNRYVLNEQVGSPDTWRYTWAIRDDVTLQSHCDFCGREGLRLTYEVARQGSNLWICANCVGRYPISADVEGMELEPPYARAHAHGLTARLKQQTCQDTIRRVQTALPDPALEEVVVYFDRNLQLSPQHAASLFGAMLKIGEETDARIFEIQTRSKAHQDEFGDLAENDRRLVWIALTPQQRRRLASLGHAPAGTVVRRGRSFSPRDAGGS